MPNPKTSRVWITRDSYVYSNGQHAKQVEGHVARIGGLSIEKDGYGRTYSSDFAIDVCWESMKALGINLRPGQCKEFRLVEVKKRKVKQ